MGAFPRVPKKSTDCINKADIYPLGVQEIAAYCRDEGIVLAGQIVFDEAITAAMLNGEPVTAYAPDSQASKDIRRLWGEVTRALDRLE